ncbi:MAG TPA: DUF2784 domain-containing protein [Vicinamibacterales bacterium]|nr:DUF2784 domain-containing protein [Vicinamibacterales bacterium]
MLYLFLATLIVCTHACFIVLVVAGGLVVLRRPWFAWVHVPAAVWGAWIELSGGICPLTPLENTLRARAGAEGYAGDFLDHYVVSLIYPAGLTREMQLALGAAVIVLNVVVYAIALKRRASRRRDR